MRLLLVSALLGGALALPAPQDAQPTLAPALPLEAFEHHLVTPLTLDEVRNKQFNLSTPHSTDNGFSIAATCGNPRIRKEWDRSTDAERADFVNAVKCLLGRNPSGQFSNAKNRYEDLVALHQSLTDNVHGNSKFIIWHRYFLWTFEDVLRTECGMQGSIPWFDETRYSGRFAQSSIFSSAWFGSASLGGQCVRDGQFAGLTLNVGPGTGNGAHCLARNLNEQLTASTNGDMVNGCVARTDYADMAGCLEGGVHVYGHNGIGAVMSDMYSSPGDPLFWLHHAFVDRNYRIWQNADPNRVTYIDGRDRFGNQLTMDTTVLVGGIRPNRVVRDIINTMDETLCYRYDY